MSKKKIWITAAVCVVAAAALVAALRIAGQNQPAPEPENNLIPVETVSPKEGDLANQMDFVGSLASADSVAVVPKLTAKVKEVRVKAGDSVKAGDVLYVMDTSDYSSQIDLAKLALESAQTSYELTSLYTLDAQENGAYLQYDQARDAYHDADDLYDDLTKNKAANIKDMEAAIAGAKILLDNELAANWSGMTAEQALAQAQKTVEDERTAWIAGGGNNRTALDAAEANLAKLNNLKNPYDTAVSTLANYQSGIAQAEAARSAAKSGYNAAKISYEAVSGDARAKQEELASMQLEQAQINYNALLKQMNDATVTAPVDGTVLSVGVQKDNFATTSSVVMLGSDQSMKVSFGLPTNYFGQVQVGDAATVQTSAGSAAAAVSEVAPMVNPQTGTFTVTAEFANTAGFLPGATAKVTLTTQHAENVLTIPVDCIRFEDNKPYVYLEQEGFAQKTFITLGITDETVYEVTGGLKASDKVISTWHPNLADGAAVSAQ